MRKIYLLKFLLLIILNVNAQVPIQKIRGTVYDNISKQPLEGAQVFLKGTDPFLGAVTDEKGEFLLEDIPVGRYNIQATFIGYSSYSEDLLVKAGSDPILNIGLSPSLEELEEVIISEKPFTLIPGTLNRKVTIEQATRFAANYQDPARVMTSFPGVIVQNDQNNNIIVNGKSPNGILWRVEGMDVVNPNHLSNAGTLSDRPTQAGGGVNILNAQVLGETNFITMPFSAQYGNAFSGIMDMSIRQGNKYDQEYSIQAGLIGLDVAAEGPIKEKTSSYLANYRYSTVGLLSALGLDFGGEVINFQDLSLKLDFDHKKGGHLSFFAFGGASITDFIGDSDPQQWTIDKDSLEIFYDSKMMSTGFSDVRPLSSSSSLTYGVTYSYSENQRDANSISASGDKNDAENFSAKYHLISGKIVLNSKIGQGSTLKVGAMLNYYANSLFASETFSGRGVIADGEEAGVLFQPYIQYFSQLSSKFSAEAGLRYMYYTFNKTNSLLPNLKLNYSYSTSGNIFLNYGWSAQKQDPTIYIPNSVNKDLELTKIQHIGAGMNKIIENTLITSALFYQHMYDIPVTELEPQFSVINDLNTLITIPLYSFGTAEIYGINASFERPFNNGYYHIVSGSLYESKYKGGDNIKRNSRYNGNYSVCITAGREIQRKRSEEVAKMLNLDMRFLYSGGLRTSAVDVELSKYWGRTIFENNNLFEDRLADYLRLDLRIAWRKEKENYTRVLSLDIQNVFSRENDGFKYYDFRKGEVVLKKQLGIIPIIAYRVEF